MVQKSELLGPVRGENGWKTLVKAENNNIQYVVVHLKHFQN